jgi:hypothetical protein
MRRNTNLDFWGRVEVEQGGCIVWLGATDEDGYGLFRFNGRMVRANRFAYEDTFGPIPDGYMVCHECDTPPCVHPEHLFLGTARDNTQDMIRKGRKAKLKGEWTPERRARFRELIRGTRPKGEQCKHAKLDEAKVRQMRQIRSETGRPYSELAAMFGVTKRAARRAITGETWGHIQ